MLRLANRWTVDTLDTFVVFRLELKSSKKFIYHFFLFNGGVSNAADPDELSSFGMLKDLTVFVFKSTTQPADGHWKHNMNGKENRIRAGCTMNFFWSWLAVENIPGWRRFWWHLESPTSWDSLSIEWQCRPILWNPTENDAATARRNTISDTWLISMKFTICFRCSGPYTKFLCSLWGIWTVWCHQVPVSILTLFLGDLTCLSSRDCLCHIIGILPSHQLYWTQHQLTWDALLASAETWAEWLSLSVGWPSPQGLDSASGGQADIGAPTPTNPDSLHIHCNFFLLLDIQNSTA